MAQWTDKQQREIFHFLFLERLLKISDPSLYALKGGALNMTSIEIFSKNVFFTTREFALMTNVAVATASRQLKKLAQGKALVAVTRGIWAQTHHPYYTPYGVVPYLLGNEQGYISFLTALHRHGVISQIPAVIQIATTGHGRKLKTPIGVFEFFKIQPRLMQSGVQSHSGKIFYNMAIAEKALLDCLYISSRKKNRFSSFPEMNTEIFDKKELKRLFKKSSSQVQKLINNRLCDFLV